MNSWTEFCSGAKIRITVPDEYPILDYIDVPRMVERRKTVNDHLLNLIKPWKEEEYAPTTWSTKAYTKMFEKFQYSDPCPCIMAEYEDEWNFANRVCLDEYSYMQDSRIIPIFSTSKNTDSTPAFPKFLEFETEQHYIDTCGWKEYIDEWNSEDWSRKPLWWVFLKNEILKKKKIQDNDIRMIMCTDPVFTRIGAAYEEHQNNLMKNMTETKEGQVGWTPFFGGFHQRMARLEKENRHYIEMDWTRFDGTIPQEVFKNIKHMRFFFLHPEHKNDEKTRKRYNWYVKNLIEKTILLPTGEITVVPKGNPSGQISTTTDNIMVNTWLTAFEIAYQHKKQHDRVPSLMEYRENVTSICYGDDRLLSVDKNFIDYDPKITIAMYKEIFGMWVKPENVKVSDRLEGLSFCGFTVIKKDGTYLGVPNVNKIFSSLRTPVKRLPDIEALWCKLTSLRLLVHNCDKEIIDYIEEQMYRVQQYCDANGIDLVKMPAGTYDYIWSTGADGGGPK